MSDKDLALCCLIAYDPVETAVARYHEELGFLAVPIGDSGYQGYVLDDHTLCIRGSQNLTEWLTDIDSVLDDQGYHSGFHKATGHFHSIPTTVTTYTGHSLGGAIAVILGHYASYARPVNVVTFGCPRVSIHPLQAKCYVNGNDPVPGLPFGLPPTGTPVACGTSSANPLECHLAKSYLRVFQE